MLQTSHVQHAEVAPYTPAGSSLEGHQEQQETRQGVRGVLNGPGVRRSGYAPYSQPQSRQHQRET
jgi:hypothetical protein